MGINSLWPILRALVLWSFAIVTGLLIGLHQLQRIDQILFFLAILCLPLLTYLLCRPSTEKAPPMTATVIMQTTAIHLWMLATEFGLSQWAHWYQHAPVPAQTTGYPGSLTIWPAAIWLAAQLHLRLQSHSNIHFSDLLPLQDKQYSSAKHLLINGMVNTSCCITLGIIWTVALLLIIAPFIPSNEWAWNSRTLTALLLGSVCLVSPTIMHFIHHHLKKHRSYLGQTLTGLLFQGICFTIIITITRWVPKQQTNLMQIMSTLFTSHGPQLLLQPSIWAICSIPLLALFLAQTAHQQTTKQLIQLNGLLLLLQYTARLIITPRLVELPPVGIALLLGLSALLLSMAPMTVTLITRRHVSLTPQIRPANSHLSLRIYLISTLFTLLSLTEPVIPLLFISSFGACIALVIVILCGLLCLVHRKPDKLT